MNEGLPHTPQTLTVPRINKLTRKQALRYLNLPEDLERGEGISNDHTSFAGRQHNGIAVGVRCFRLSQIRSALKLEVETGMKHSRGSILALSKREFGLTGQKKKMLTLITSLMLKAEILSGCPLCLRLKGERIYGSNSKLQMSTHRTFKGRPICLFCEHEEVVG